MSNTKDFMMQLDEQEKINQMKYGPISGGGNSLWRDVYVAAIASIASNPQSWGEHQDTLTLLATRLADASVRTYNEHWGISCD